MIRPIIVRKTKRLGNGSCHYSNGTNGWGDLLAAGRKFSERRHHYLAGERLMIFGI